MGGDPTKQAIALGATCVALILFIAAAGTSDWQHQQVLPKAGGAISTTYIGAFRECQNNDCLLIMPDCTTRGQLCSPNCGKLPQPQCNQIRTTQGFLVLALLLCAAAAIVMGLVRFNGKEINSKIVVILLALASVFAIVSFSVYMSYSYSNAFTIGAGIGLTITAWLLCMSAGALWHFGTI